MDIGAGGANADPFKTFHNEMNLPMWLRIAPELALKQLVIGGKYFLDPAMFSLCCNYLLYIQGVSLQSEQSNLALLRI